MTIRRNLLSIIWIGVGVLLGTALFMTWPKAHAYPEYTDRTGQQCTTCHVNPAGGGPRTLRGLIWIAEGRPDEVPTLPGADQEIGADTLDGPALFVQFDCARCHGSVGEGDIAGALNQSEWDTEQLKDILRNGSDGMKGYPPENMSDEAMETLIPHLQAMGRGEIEATVFLQQRPLAPPRMICGSESEPRPAATTCGGN